MTTDKSGKLGPFICLLGVALQNGYLCAADIRFIFTELDIETGETDKCVHVSLFTSFYNVISFQFVSLVCVCNHWKMCCCCV